MKPTNEFEHKYWPLNKTVLGIDEAGRGPLAGPMVVAGVILPIGYDSGDINDSKQLTEKKREELYDVIIRDALYYDIKVVEPEVIDELNPLAADRKAMTEIAVNAPTDIILTDAVELYIDKEVTAIIKGDAKSCSIAAASILAKVTRDRIMMEYDKLYPQYGFAKHKGYGTKQHLDALHRYGVTPIHRKSYKPVFDCLQETLF
ncbi:MAG: ribonuclease HII [Erysipelotrichaceae bacterium]|nr:ribonuclease HII [Erysipelotrichaceae bacterium]